MSGTATSALRISSGSSARSHCSTCKERRDESSSLVHGWYGAAGAPVSRSGYRHTGSLRGGPGLATTVSATAHLHALLVLQSLRSKHKAIVHVVAAEQHLRQQD